MNPVMTEKTKQPTDMQPESVDDTASIDENQDAELAAVEDAAAAKVAGKSKDAAGEDDDSDKRKLEYADDPRDDIEEAIAKAKDEGKSPTDKYRDEQPDEDPEQDAGPERDDTEDTTADADKQPTDKDDDPIVKVKVDGVEREIRQSQLIATYQKDAAADKRLQEATELLREAKAVKAAKPTETADTEDQPDADNSTDQGDKEAERLANIVDKLQLGERDEAIEGLKQLLEEAQKGAQPPEDLDQRIRATASEERERERSQQTLEKFYAENGVLSENKRLASVFRSEIDNQMRTDIRGVLAAEDVPEPEIDKLMTSMNEAQMIQLHRSYRANGLSVRDTGKVLSAAKQALEADGFWPQQAKPNVDREARKQQTAQQQPAPRSHRTPIPSRDNASSKVQTTADVVREENEARGLPTM
jgi:hypothetical protein